MTIVEYVKWLLIHEPYKRRPDTQVAYADTAQVPIRVGDTTGRDVVSADFSIAFDANVVTVLGLELTGSLVETGWLVE